MWRRRQGGETGGEREVGNREVEMKVPFWHALTFNKWLTNDRWGKENLAYSLVHR